MRIAAEVARAWFEATGAGEELRAQRAAAATFQQTLELKRSRAALGDVSGADVDAAHEQWAAANAVLPGIEARQRGAVLGLGVLPGDRQGVGEGKSVCGRLDHGSGRRIKKKKH